MKQVFVILDQFYATVFRYDLLYCLFSFIPFYKARTVPRFHLIVWYFLRGVVLMIFKFDNVDLRKLTTGGFKCELIEHGLCLAVQCLHELVLSFVK